MKLFKKKKKRKNMFKGTRKYFKRLPYTFVVLALMGYFMYELFVAVVMLAVSFVILKILVLKRKIF